MLILAIDSSTDTFGAALIRGERIIGEFRYERPRGQLTHLLPSINELIRVTGSRREDIGLLAAVTGPGSFTGLRLALITAKTIAQLISVPVAGLNTLDTIAANVTDRHRLVVAALDARKSEIFAAFYRNSEEGQEILSDYMTFTPQSFIERLKSENEQLIITGNALQRYGSDIAGALAHKAELLAPSFWYPGAAGMIPLLKGIISRREFRSHRDMDIFYMRASDAEPRAGKEACARG